MPRPAPGPARRADTCQRPALHRNVFVGARPSRGSARAAHPLGPPHFMRRPDASGVRRRRRRPFVAGVLARAARWRPQIGAQERARPRQVRQEQQG